MPSLTLIIHPSIETSSYESSGNNSYKFTYERGQLIKFFKVLISANKDLKICYSFNPPSQLSKKNRILQNEISISFACLLSCAEAAAYKDVPIYMFPESACSESKIIETEKEEPLNITDFKGIFSSKLDLNSVQEMSHKLQNVGNFSVVSYPEAKIPNNDEKNLNFTGHLIVSPISSEDICNLLANGSNVVVSDGSNESYLMTICSQRSRDWNNFGISWKTQKEKYSHSCGYVRVPVVVKSNEIFYSNRGSEFMKVLKTDMKELVKNVHNNERKKMSYGYYDDSDDSDTQTSDGFVLASEAEEPKENDKVENDPPKSVVATKTDEEASNSDTEVSLNAKQLTSFLNQFKNQMRDELVGVVEDTVKKYTQKNHVENATSAKAEAEIRSVINVNDCIKSETDDSDLPKLLNTLSQIEEQLNSIENGTNSDVALAKTNKYTHACGTHGNHRRARDFGSLARRNTLSILKKRMKGSVIELEPDLFAISKSGFKLKMARNVSQSFRFVLFKYGKYRNSKFEVDFMPTIVPSGGLECCVKPATKNHDKSQVDDTKGLYSFYDVRFKSKDRHGKFRCFLKILRNGKVCGHPLCISVRVKRFCSNADQIDSAEEALPGYLDWRARADEEYARFSSRYVRRDEYDDFDGTTSGGNVDVDEGISGFQEYPSSISCDSDDAVDANRENDNDEGIDPGLRMPCAAFEKLNINDERAARKNFDNESDSSVSLLLDESEVRESIEDADTVKIPLCFIPNANISKESMSVRVKRKIKAARKKKVEESAATSSEKSLPTGNSWWTKANGEFDVNESLKRKGAVKPCAKIPSLFPSMSSPERAAYSSQHSPTYENSGAAKAASQTATEFTPPYKPLYPRLAELTQTPTKTAKDTLPSPVAILPEKVFEMTGNVLKNVQKNMDETFMSISRSVLDVLAPPILAQPTRGSSSTAPSTAQPTAAPPAAAAAASRPAATGPASPPAATASAAAPTATANWGPFEFPSGSTSECRPPQTNYVTSSSLWGGPQNISWGRMPAEDKMKVPPPSAPRSATVGTNTTFETVSASTSVANANLVNAATASSVAPEPSTEPVPSAEPPVIPVKKRFNITNTPPNPQPQQNGAVHIDGGEYNQLEPQIRQQILLLNEMGFMNDNYNLFLIRKYPQDINKVVESLVNYSEN